MRRDKYDKVQEYIKHHKDATMKEAFHATKVSPGTYYNQANAVAAASSKRGKASSASGSYELMNLETSYEPPTSQVVKPGMVGVIGAPEDVARLLASLARGGA